MSPRLSFLALLATPQLLLSKRGDGIQPALANEPGRGKHPLDLYFALPEEMGGGGSKHLPDFGLGFPLLLADSSFLHP